MRRWKCSKSGNSFWLVFVFCLISLLHEKDKRALLRVLIIFRRGAFFFDFSFVYKTVATGVCPNKTAKKRFIFRPYFVSVFVLFYVK